MCYILNSLIEREVIMKIAKNMGKILLSLALFCSPLTIFAEAGCCSHHGGVTGCDTSGHLMCKDGTDSPTCPCSGAVSHKLYKAHPAKTSVMRTSTKVIKTSPKKVKQMVIVPTKTKGCCARHGGVNSCNKSAGFLMCKDGSQSATCACN